MPFGQITDVPGIKVGHCEDLEALTGCTVVLAETGAACGVDVRGSAPGTRETDLLDPINVVPHVHGIALCGGSAFGLDAASGVMQYLEEKDIGFDTGVAKVPIVPGAVLFDLGVGNPKKRPDKQMGYEAARNAEANWFRTGNAGAGAGATVGKLAGFGSCMKGGIGSASMTLKNGITIGALVAVNAVGEVRDPATQKVLAGPYDRERKVLLDSLDVLQERAAQAAGSNTTIGIIAVNADLTKAEAKKVAQMAHDGYARTIYPVHTMQDGDAIFAMATGGAKVPVDVIGTIAAKVMEEAVINAVQSAESVQGIPCSKDIVYP